MKIELGLAFHYNTKKAVTLFLQSAEGKQKHLENSKLRASLSNFPQGFLFPFKFAFHKILKGETNMGLSEDLGDDIQPRSYWRWSKQDFFPEESFQNWGTYQSALSQIGPRFKNRLVARSDDANEVGELRKQSEHDMKRCLTWWDLTWFGFGSVIGAGIFVLSTGQEAHDNAGPAIVLSYVASGVSAMLSIFCYTEFAIEIPVAGGSFAYLRVELGDFAAFITAMNILFFFYRQK